MRVEVDAISFVDDDVLLVEFFCVCTMLFETACFVTTMDFSFFLLALEFLLELDSFFLFEVLGISIVLLLLLLIMLLILLFLFLFEFLLLSLSFLLLLLLLLLLLVWFAFLLLMMLLDDDDPSLLAMMVC